MLGRLAVVGVTSMLLAGAALVGCAGEPQVIVQTVVVEREVSG